MPKLTQPFRDSQKFFIENTVTPIIEENRKLPIQVRKSDSRIIEEIAFRFGKTSKSLYRYLEQYGKQSNPQS